MHGYICEDIAVVVIVIHGIITAFLHMHPDMITTTHLLFFVTENI